MNIEILRRAKAHHLAYERLIEAPLEQHHLHQEFGFVPDEEVMELAAPAFVLGSFAVELYLKFLLSTGGAVPPHTHDLLDLWKLLPDAQTTSLDAAGLYGPFGSLPAERWLSDVSSFVDIYAHAFHDWRYPWDAEDPRMDPSALDDVLEILRHECDGIVGQSQPGGET